MTAPVPPTPGARRRAVVVGLVAFALILGVSIALGFIGHSKPTTVVVRGKAIPFEESGFDWELWALVLTGLGTTALAIATGLLAFSTWKDVRASQEIAQEARDANALARVEQDRRPELSLRADAEKLYSQVEVGGNAFVRLLVHNESGKRASRGTRVIVPQYRSWKNNVFTLGSPSLGWPSAPEAVDGSLVIFAGSERAIDLGYFVRMEIGPEYDRVVLDGPTVSWAGAPRPPETRIWCLKLALHGMSVGDGRDYLVPANCVVRLIVGGDEAEAREYDVKVFWDGNRETVQEVLDSVEIEITPVAANDGRA